MSNLAPRPLEVNHDQLTQAEPTELAQGLMLSAPQQCALTVPFDNCSKRLPHGRMIA
jgi:hypothetical protein